MEDNQFVVVANMMVIRQVDLADLQVYARKKFPAIALLCVCKQRDDASGKQVHVQQQHDQGGASKGMVAAWKPV